MISQSNQKRPKLKILCLHGYGTNKQFMKMQTSSLQKDLEKIAQLIHVDGPYIIPKQLINDPKVIKNLRGKPRSWFNFKYTHKTRSIQTGIQSMKTILKSIQAASPYYDGALCFSQGGYAFQTLYWFNKLGQLPSPTLQNMKFFVNFSSQSYRIKLKLLNYVRFDIPSLHFLSQQDFLFPKSLITPTLYDKPQIIFHNFGHRFPILGIKQKTQLRNFLKEHGETKLRNIKAKL